MDDTLRQIIDGALRGAGTMQSPIPADERESIAWMAVAEAWACWPGEGDPAAFAATVAKRRVIDEARKVHGNTAAGVSHPVYPCERMPEALVEDHHSSVEEFCADMPADVQLVVRRLAEGWRPNEIAAELGRTPGRVSQLIATARTGDRDLLVA